VLFHCLIWPIKHHESHLVHRKWSFLRQCTVWSKCSKFHPCVCEHNLLSPLADSGDNNCSDAPCSPFETSISRCLSSSALFCYCSLLRIFKVKIYPYPSFFYKELTLTYSTKMGQNHVFLIFLDCVGTEFRRGGKLNHLFKPIYSRNISAKNY